MFEILFADILKT